MTYNVIGGTLSLTQSINLYQNNLWYGLHTSLLQCLGGHSFLSSVGW